MERPKVWSILSHNQPVCSFINHGKYFTNFMSSLLAHNSKSSSNTISSQINEVWDIFSTVIKFHIYTGLLFCQSTLRHVLQLFCKYPFIDQCMDINVCTGRGDQIDKDVVQTKNYWDMAWSLMHVLGSVLVLELHVLGSILVAIGFAVL
jgi:hypothetical protein